MDSDSDVDGSEERKLNTVPTNLNLEISQANIIQCLPITYLATEVDIPAIHIYYIFSKIHQNCSEYYPQVVRCGSDKFWYTRVIHLRQ
jgi:hypothetical protein